MKSGHFDDEGEKVVDNGVKKFVHHGAPREVCDTLELVIDEKLRRHHDKAEGVDTPYGGAQHPRVPRLMLTAIRASLSAGKMQGNNRQERAGF